MIGYCLNNFYTFLLPQLLRFLPSPNKMYCNDQEIWDARFPTSWGKSDIVYVDSPYSRDASANSYNGRGGNSIMAVEYPAAAFGESVEGKQKPVGTDFYNRHRFLCAVSSSASELDPDFYGSVNPDGKTVDVSVKANPDLTSADREASEAIAQGEATPVEVIPSEKTQAIANGGEGFVARSRRKEGFCHTGPTGSTSIRGFANSDILNSTERFLDTSEDREWHNSFSLVVITVCVALITCLFIAEHIISCRDKSGLKGGNYDVTENQSAPVLSGGHIF